MPRYFVVVSVEAPGATPAATMVQQAVQGRHAHAEPVVVRVEDSWGETIWKA